MVNDQLRRRATGLSVRMSVYKYSEGSACHQEDLEVENMDKWITVVKKRTQINNNSLNKVEVRVAAREARLVDTVNITKVLDK